jgi:hypothetical protein
MRVHLFVAQPYTYKVIEVPPWWRLLHCLSSLFKQLLLTNLWQILSAILELAVRVSVELILNSFSGLHLGESIKHECEQAKTNLTAKRVACFSDLHANTQSF